MQRERQSTPYEWHSRLITPIQIQLQLIYRSNIVMVTAINAGNRREGACTETDRQGCPANRKLITSKTRKMGLIRIIELKAKLDEILSDLLRYLSSPAKYKYVQE